MSKANKVRQMLLHILKQRFTGFGLVGLAILGFGVGLLVILVHLGIDKNLAYFTQAILSIELNFIGNKFINWRDRPGKWYTQWAKFHTTKILTFGGNQLLFSGLILIPWFFSHYLITTLIGTVIATVVNYITNDKFVFNVISFKRHDVEGK